MKLRELINRLEQLSENGKNDNVKVVYDTSYDFTIVGKVVKEDEHILII